MGDSQPTCTPAVRPIWRFNRLGTRTTVGGFCKEGMTVKLAAMALWSDLRNLGGLLVSLFRPATWRPLPPEPAPAADESATTQAQVLWEEFEQRWTSRAMELLQEGRPGELHRDIAAVEPGASEYSLAPRLISLFEALAPRLAQRGETAAAKLAADYVIRLYEAELERESGGAGGAAAMRTLHEAIDRLRPLR